MSKPDPDKVTALGLCPNCGCVPSSEWILGSYGWICGSYKRDTIVTQSKECFGMHWRTDALKFRVQVRILRRMLLDSHSALTMCIPHPQAPLTAEQLQHHLEQLENFITADQRQLPEERYTVTGDHPTAARPDRFNLSYEDALFYCAELRQAGYENVVMEPYAS